MSNILMIFEGPGKFSAIKELIKAGQIPKVELAATYGHFYQILGETQGNRTSLGIDLENFEPNYGVDEAKLDKLADLEEKIKEADEVYIFADPDYEGEVIAYSVFDYFKKYKKKFYRGYTQEISAKGINEGIKQIGTTYHQNNFEAGKARAVLDRIIGWTYSSIVYKNANGLKGVSAGRCQSPALRMLAEREIEISKFSSNAYYKLHASHPKFMSHHQYNGWKDEEGNIHYTKEEVEELYEKVKNAKTAKIIKYEEGTRQVGSKEPFRGSTFKIAAANVLGLGIKDIDALSQKLYEMGKVSYIRTDAVKFEPEKDEAILALVNEEYGEEYAYAKEYKNPDSAQEGHLGIGPVKIEYTPEMAYKDLDEDLARMYEMIWKRAIASQMSNAIYDTQYIELEINKEIFIYNGSKLKFDGFLKVWDYSQSDNPDEEENSGEESWIKGFAKGDIVDINEFEVTEHKTKAKPRYNVGSCIKKLENLGIGRPSTFASIMSTLEERGYIETNGKKQQITVTEKGLQVYEILMGFAEHDIMDFDFTKKMEGGRDLLSQGKVKYYDLMSEFFAKIQETMDANGITINESGFVVFGKGGEDYSTAIESDVVDPFDKKKMLLLKNSNSGKYLKSSVNGANFSLDTEVLNEKCPTCGGLLINTTLKSGDKVKMCSYGKVKDDDGNFTCSYREGGDSKPKAESKNTGVLCPKCGEGHILERETKKGWIQVCSTATFQNGVAGGCDFFNFLGNFEETSEDCPECGAKLIITTTASGKRLKKCRNTIWNRNTGKNEGCEFKSEWIND